MPFALLIIGVFLLVAAIRGTTSQLFTLVQSDFTGSNNFIYWFLAIVIIGALGYIEKLKPISVALIALVILVLFLAKGNPSSGGGGFFQEFVNAVASGTGTSYGTVVNPGTVSIGNFGLGTGVPGVTT